MTNAELTVLRSLADDLIALQKDLRKEIAQNERFTAELRDAYAKIARLESEAETAKRLAAQGAELAKVRDELKRKLGALTMCFQREIGFKKEGGVKTLKVAKLFAAIKAVIDENDIRLVDDGMAE